MAIYDYRFNPIEGTFDLTATETSFHVKDPVDTYDDLPVSGNAENDMRFVKDTDDAYVWSIASESGARSNWLKIPLLQNLSASVIVNDSGVAGAYISNALDNLATLITTEDIWDRVTGDVIQPKNANDNVELGTGYLDAGFYKIAGTKFLHIPGTANIFLGYQAGIGLTTGQRNIGIGINSGYYLTTGNDNIFLGYYAGRKETIGNSNISIGIYAGEFSNGAYNNICIGFSAGYTNTTGYNNVIIGHQAGYNTTASDRNVLIGHQAGYANTTGYNNVIIGHQAGYANTTGYNNVIIGFRAGYNTTASDRNVLIGHQAGYNNAIADSNTFIGYNAGYTNTTGNQNTFIGHKAGYFNTTGYENVFVGNASGDDNTTGQRNVFVGNDSGSKNTTGYRNTFIGDRAGFANTVGSFNTAIGYQAGRNNITGYNNVFIGYQAGYNETGSNTLYIANTSTATPLIYGEFGNETGGVPFLRINGYLDMATNRIINVVDPTNNQDVATKIYVDNAVVTELNGLNDIEFDTGTPADNYILTYDNASGKWKAEAMSVHNSLSGLNDGDYKHLTATEKTNTDDAISKKHTQNSDTKLDDGQANEVTSANLRTHLDSLSNPHIVTVDQLDLATGTVASDLDDAVTKRHTQNTDVALRTDKLIVDVDGNTTITGELGIKVYEQASQPDLGDEKLAIWIDTDDNGRVYLLFSRGTGSQVAVELS